MAIFCKRIRKAYGEGSLNKNWRGREVWLGEARGSARLPGVVGSGQSGSRRR